MGDKLAKEARDFEKHALKGIRELQDRPNTPFDKVLDEQSFALQREIRALHFLVKDDLEHVDFWKDQGSGTTSVQRDRLAVNGPKLEQLLDRWSRVEAAIDRRSSSRRSTRALWISMKPSAPAPVYCASPSHAPSMLRQSRETELPTTPQSSQGGTSN